MPAAAGAGREDEELAAVALYKVAVGVPFVPNSRSGVLRATRMRNAFCAERRYNCRIISEREAAEDRQTEDREVEPA